MIFLTLIYEFFKTGLFAVGGGLATLPFLTEICHMYTWFTEQNLSDMIAISESTPGPIGVNMSTFAGFQAAGVPGAIVATCALVLPSLIVIILISKFLEKFDQHPLVKNAFTGLRPAVTGLITAAMASVMKIALLDIPAFTESKNILDLINFPALALFALLFAGMMKFKKLHPIVFIAVAAACGIAFGYAKQAFGWM